MNRTAFFAIAALALFCAGCLEAFDTATPTPKKPLASPSAAASTATPAPTALILPSAASTPVPTPTPLPARVSALFSSRFGFSPANSGATGASDDYSLATAAGAHWDRPVAGPFNWQEIEYAKGGYDFSKADAYVASASKAGFAVLGVVWPFNDWDQKACRPISCNAPDAIGLAKMRCKPCDMAAYKAFLSAMVLRYSNADTPVKYWEIASEQQPSAGPSGDFFKGSPQEYAELLNESYSTIKEACADCKVLSGGLAGAGQPQLDFFSQVIDAGGANCFDIASIHSGNDAADGNAAALRALLQSKNASKPVWVTQYSFGSGRHPPRQMPQYGNYFITDDEHARLVFEGIVRAFAAGAEKVFYSALGATAAAGPIRQSESLVSEGSAKRPAFAAYRLLASKLAGFSRARGFKEGRYAFAIGNSTTYALWGAGSLPSGMPDRVVVTDYLGKSTAMPLSSLALSDAPVLVEPDTGG